MPGNELCQSVDERQTPVVCQRQRHSQRACFAAARLPYYPTRTALNNAIACAIFFVSPLTSLCSRRWFPPLSSPFAAAFCPAIWQSCAPRMARGMLGWAARRCPITRARRDFQSLPGSCLASPLSCQRLGRTLFGVGRSLSCISYTTYASCRWRKPPRPRSL